MAASTTTTIMAATTSATLLSSFSTARHALTTPIAKHLAPETRLKFGYTKTLHLPLAAQHCAAGEPVFWGSPAQVLWRLRRLTAAVASEEAVEKAEEPAEEDGGGVDGVDDQQSQDQVSTKLYIGNLPYHCDSAQLAGILQQYAIPELVEVLYDRQTGKSRGYAFVTMSSVEDCHAVIENLDGSEYGGRYLRVNFADKPRKMEQLYPETEHKLFVGSLAWSVTSESLYQAFEEYGNVVSARVCYDGETGKSRGYGFVCYATRSEMENALASLNGMELEGRAVRVSMAEGKKS